MKTFGACIICGAPGQVRCRPCLDVLALAQRYDPAELVLIVDGSFLRRRGSPLGDAGAGLVIATSHNEAVIAYCAASFAARSSQEAEHQAVIRGLRWSGLPVAWTDCDSAERVFKGRAMFIPPELREPLHNFAHHLSYAASHGDEGRLGRIWVPAAVW